MMRQFCMRALLGMSLVGCALAGETSVKVLATSPQTGLATLPASVSGRVLREADGDRYQWPGLYFEAAFEGSGLYFKVGPGDVILRVLVDAVEAATLVKPAAGWYQVAGLAAGAHQVRVEALTESQAGPNRFDGFALPAGAKALPAPRRVRQIEFIGDSHTVGYGNTSPSQECSGEQVWATTDNTRAFGPVTARHYQADYRINAISGRGVVRNYNGFAADPLPVAYSHLLFDHGERDAATSWHPQVIVIALGTNDFSTPLNPGEPWKTRAALHADYEASYVKFVQALRAANPQARFVLWATDGANGEIEAEVRTVLAKLKAAGETRIDFVPVHKLTMSACHGHPSVADDKTISDALIKQIDAHALRWPSS